MKQVRDKSCFGGADIKKKNYKTCDQTMIHKNRGQSSSGIQKSKIKQEDIKMLQN